MIDRSSLFILPHISYINQCRLLIFAKHLLILPSQPISHLLPLDTPNLTPKFISLL